MEHLPVEEHALQALCEQHEHCGLPASHGSSCILHSSDTRKSKDEFADALSRHLESRGYRCVGFHFPEKLRLPDVLQDACFEEAHFYDKFDGSNVKFQETCSFARAVFHESASFWGATFTDSALFYRTEFRQQVSFTHAVFCADAVFDHAKLLAYNSGFADSVFRANAYFRCVSMPPITLFMRADFRGRAEFVGEPTSPIFDGSTADMTEMRGSSGIVFVSADLSEVDLRYTDVRGVRFCDVSWGKRQDFIKRLSSRARQVRTTAATNQTAAAPLIALMSSLRANYENAGDFELAGTFRYSEKELRRLDRGTALSARVFLTLYKTVADYGESLMRPLLILLLAASALGPLLLYLGMADSRGMLIPNQPRNTLPACVFAFQTLLLQKSSAMTPHGLAALMVTCAMQILGPMLVGVMLFALGRRVTR